MAVVFPVAVVVVSDHVEAVGHVPAAVEDALLELVVPGVVLFVAVRVPLAIDHFAAVLLAHARRGFLHVGDRLFHLGRTAEQHRERSAGQQHGCK